jgi:hypothetical protein
LQIRDEEKLLSCSGNELENDRILKLFKIVRFV